jgi:phosphatidylinositol alpha-1,6-mannosyltransferase
VQVSAQFLAAGSGGIARCARLTIAALAGAGAEVRALAVEDTSATDVAGGATRAFGGDRMAFIGANTLGALRCDWVFYDFAGTARAHAPLRALARPYALWVHGLEVWPGYLRRDYAAAIRGARAVFANSEHTARRLAESLPGLRSVRVCRLGTERDDTVGEPTRGGRDRLVLFVGRSDEMFAKGQDVLIAAWPRVVAQVPDAVLAFVGGGERLDRLTALAAASPAASSIRVLGPLPDAEVDALQRRARLFAMISNVEGFGLVFAEAMGHATPVLSALEDASTEINLDGETGYTVARGDLDAVASRIVAVLTDDRLFERLSDRAYMRWRREFSFSAFRDRFVRAAGDAGLLGHSPRPVADQTGVRPRFTIAEEGS